ncbi:MAG: AsmA family protein [Methylococcales bacterium]|jgi:AsmA protein|nr:AsmA family protein [Methylococcales bacterium]
MSKFIKSIVALISLVLVCLIGVAVYLNYFFNPNDYKPLISEQVKLQTGRTLLIQEDIKWSFFPWVGLKLGKIQLSNAEGFGEQPFVSVKNIKASVQLSLLIFKQKLVIDTIAVDGMTLRLAKNKKGDTNLDDIVKHQAQLKSGSVKSGSSSNTVKDKEVKSPSSSSNKKPSIDLEELLTKFSINGIEITNISLYWQDQQTGESMQVTPVNLVLGKLMIAQSIPFQLDFKVEDQLRKMQHQGKIKANLWANKSLKHFKVESLNVALNSSGGELPPKGINIELKTEIDAQLEKQLLSLKPISLMFNQLKMQASVNGEKIMSQQPEFDVDFKLLEFNLKTLLSSFEIPAPVTSDVAVLEKISASIKLNANLNSLNLSSLEIKLDDSTINGNATVKNFNQPKINFKLALDEINVDRYLPPPAKQEATAANENVPIANKEASSETNAEKQRVKIELPVEMLKSQWLDGELTIAKLIVKKLKIDETVVKIQDHHGDIVLDHRIGKFYQGIIEGKTKVDVRLTPPKYSLNEKISSVMLGPLVKDAAEKDVIKGQANMFVDVTTQGDYVDVLKQQLNGKLNFIFKEGAIIGVDVTQKIKEAKAALSNKTPQSTGKNQTDFGLMKGSAKITNGVLNNQDLIIKATFLQITGSGTVNLPKENLQYKLEAAVTRSNQSQLDPDLKEIEGVAVPIAITGPFTSPKVKVDMKKVLKALAKQRLKVKEKELKKKAQQKLKEKLKTKKLENKLKDKLKSKKLNDKFKKLFKF